MKQYKTSIFIIEMPNDSKVACYTYVDIHRITGIAISTLSKYLSNVNTLILKNIKVTRVPIIRDQRGRKAN